MSIRIVPPIFNVGDDFAIWEKQFRAAITAARAAQLLKDTNLQQSPVDEELKTTVQFYLSAEALQYAHRAGLFEAAVDFDGVVAGLAARFASKKSPSWVRQQLSTMTRLSTESLRGYADRIRRVAADSKTPIDEADLVRTFVSSLMPPLNSIALQEKDTSTLAEMLELAVQLQERLTRHPGIESSVPAPQQQRIKPERPTCTYCGIVGHTNSICRRRIGDEQRAAIQNRPPMLHSLPPPQMPPRLQNVRLSPPQIQQQQPNRPPPSNPPPPQHQDSQRRGGGRYALRENPRQRRGNAAAITCFQCNQLGHYARDCPQRHGVAAVSGPYVFNEPPPLQYEPFDVRNNFVAGSSSMEPCGFIDPNHQC